MSVDKKKGRKIIIILAVVLIVIVAFGIISRVISERRLNAETQEDAHIIVKVIKPAKSAANEEVSFPGTVQAWHEAPIYARTNGYLKKWLVGLGSAVKEGDLLAEIDSPEVDSQLRQAQAELANTKANNELAQSTNKRWMELLKTSSVSKQEADEKKSDALAKSAAVLSAQANVDRLQNLESFKHVLAPFDGMITSRTTDVGDLITSGSTTGQILFRISQSEKLRVYVQVPEAYAGAIKPELTAELHFAARPGEVWKQQIYHMADALEPTSRTLLVEFVVDNKERKLFPGGYVEVHLNLGTFAESLRLPSNALMFRGTDVEVAVIEKSSNNSAHAMLKKVSLGRDFGNDVEIAGGLNENDQVILNPPDSLVSGQNVRISVPEKEKPKQDGAK